MAVSAIDPILAGSDMSRDVLRGILNASRESVLVVDSSMRITAANDPAHEAFARQIERLNERRLTEVIRDVIPELGLNSDSTTVQNSQAQGQRDVRP